MLPPCIRIFVSNLLVPLLVWMSCPVLDRAYGGHLTLGGAYLKQDCGLSQSQCAEGGRLALEWLFWDGPHGRSGDFSWENIRPSLHLAGGPNGPAPLMMAGVVLLVGAASGLLFLASLAGHYQLGLFADFDQQTAGSETYEAVQAGLTIHSYFIQDLSFAAVVSGGGRWGQLQRTDGRADSFQGAVFKYGLGWIPRPGLSGPFIRYDRQIENTNLREVVSDEDSARFPVRREFDVWGAGWSFWF